MGFQRLGRGLQNEHQRCDLEAQLLLVGDDVLFLAEGFQIGDIGLVELGHMGDHHPVAMQVRPLYDRVLVKRVEEETRRQFPRLRSSYVSSGSSSSGARAGKRAGDRAELGGHLKPSPRALRR